MSSHSEFQRTGWQFLSRESLKLLELCCSRAKPYNAWPSSTLRLRRKLMPDSKSSLRNISRIYIRWRGLRWSCSQDAPVGAWVVARSLSSEFIEKIEDEPRVKKEWRGLRWSCSQDAPVGGSSSSKRDKVEAGITDSLKSESVY